MAEDLESQDQRLLEREDELRKMNEALEKRESGQ